MILFPKQRAPEALLIGRRSLEEIQGVLLLQDWVWNAEINQWMLRCRLSPNMDPGGPIPPNTDWYVFADPTYPLGGIKFYPALEGGLEKTFHHQLHNGRLSPNGLWRTGEICLDSTVATLNRHTWTGEPYTADERLPYYVKRAISWLEAASSGQLTQPGDPFELPDFSVDDSVTLAFSENASSFDFWQTIEDRVGITDLASFKPGAFYTRCFRSTTGKGILSIPWGALLNRADTEIHKGIWILLNSVPTLFPWQAPATLGELRDICHSQGADFDKLLRNGFGIIRDGKRHILLIGFPIPEKIGAPISRIHWQGVLLPSLSHGKKTQKGFRPNDKGYWLRDQREILHGNHALSWINSENWDQEQTTTRGRLPLCVADRRYLLIGGGALGSPIGELLTRGATNQIMIVDSGRIEVGNLTRHILDLSQLQENKAKALAERINRCSPHANVDYIEDVFPPKLPYDKARCNDSEIVLDCTGSDEVITALGRFEWDKEKIFFSLSMGFGARRLFCFSAMGKRFPSDSFTEQITPWLSLEQQENEGKDLPREGIGCWHPVFPARNDDVWMLASVAIKYIEAALSAASPMTKPDLTVYEQYYENGIFAGLRCAWIDK